MGQDNNIYDLVNAFLGSLVPLRANDGLGTAREASPHWRQTTVGRRAQDKTLRPEICSYSYVS
jgi:hypothetical protein